MAQAGARAALGDPAIAALVRRVQDLSSQYAAVGEQIDIQYSQPAKQQDPALIESLQKATASSTNRWPRPPASSIASSPGTRNSSRLIRLRPTRRNGCFVPAKRWSATTWLAIACWPG